MTRTEGGPSGASGDCACDPSVVAGEGFFRTLVESASEAIVTVDEAGGIVFANPAAAELFGHEPGELVGRSVTAFLPEGDRPRVREAFEALRSEAPTECEGIETVARHRDGRLVPVELSLRAHREGEERLLTAVVRDISDRHAERVERRRERDLTERQRTAVETTYYAGFFEWPRESTGEEVAESLGISAPTFHKHLRVAERKLLAARFGDGLTAE
jgi:PAS domain S-box-containing protein